MNKLKKARLGLFASICVSVLVVVIAVGMSVGAFSGVANTVMENVNIESYNGSSSADNMELGALVGPDVYSNLRVHGKFVSGGGILYASSSLSSALTLTAAQVCDNSIIYTLHASGISNIAMTLPATTTLFNGCLSEQGGQTSFMYCNESTGFAASTTTITAGTGMDMFEPDGEDVVIEDNNCAMITMTRLDLGATDLKVVVQEFIDAY